MMEEFERSQERFGKFLLCVFIPFIIVAFTILIFILNGLQEEGEKRREAVVEYYDKENKVMEEVIYREKKREYGWNMEATLLGEEKTRYLYVDEDNGYTVEEIKLGD